MSESDGVSKQVARLRAHLESTTTWSFEHVAPLSRRDIERAEATVGAVLPSSYKELVCSKQNFVVRDGQGDDYFRFVAPKEALGILKRVVDEFEEDAFGSEPDEIEAAHAELAFRRRLYPFQYASTYVYDFHCFHLDDAKGDSLRIVEVYHDDYELADWIPKGALNEESDYSFAAHLQGLVDKIVEG